MKLSDKSKEILQASCASSTLKQYDSVMSKWKLFCSYNLMDPCRPTIDIIISFLTNLYEQGLGYVSINSARSALSTMLGHIDGQSIGSHPLITRFVKGVSRLRPPTCKYKTTWDANVVLKFVQSWPQNCELSFKDLSLKLVALLALCTGQRVQTLVSIQVEEVIVSRTSVIINISSRLKTSIPGKGHQMKFNKFSNTKLCIFSCLNEYIQRTVKLRIGKKLLIITKAPYGAACTQTISNWLMKVLKLSGVDVNVFSSHSYRHASTSKALSLGVSLDNIYKSAGWNENSKVFAKFYNKPLENSLNFSNAILSGVRKK